LASRATCADDVRETATLLVSCKELKWFSWLIRPCLSRHKPLQTAAKRGALSLRRESLRQWVVVHHVRETRCTNECGKHRGSAPARRLGSTALQVPPNQADLLDKAWSFLFHLARLPAARCTSCPRTETARNASKCLSPADGVSTTSSHASTQREPVATCRCWTR